MQTTNPRAIGRGFPQAGLRALHLLIAGAFAVGVAGWAAPAAAQNAAVVNGKAIPKAKVDEFMKALATQGRPDNDETRKLVTEELVAREIFVQEADKRGLTRSSDVQLQLDNARQDILIRAMIRDHLTRNPVNDADIGAEYEKFKTESSAGGKEYKARHILVEKEDEAKKIIADIKKGAKFEDLAKQSKDPGSGSSGGDLGWNTSSTFVKEFGDAMAALEKGKMTQAPVKSQFGWHVIRLDDVREAAPPPLEQVKPQIQQQLERQKIQQLQKDLRAAAKVE
jgi:peptidyl-prolyl cis-trans isomerase C